MTDAMLQLDEFALFAALAFGLKHSTGNQRGYGLKSLHQHPHCVPSAIVPHLDKCLKFMSIRGGKNDCIL